MPTLGVLHKADLPHGVEQMLKLNLVEYLSGVDDPVHTLYNCKLTAVEAALQSAVDQLATTTSMRAKFESLAMLTCTQFGSCGDFLLSLLMCACWLH